MTARTTSAASALRLALPVVLLLALWATRLPALEALPLHNDEGLHLTRAVEVWNLHPFWQISDGKIINHWLIAAFYPQSAPVFVGRIATVFVALVGLAAALRLMRRFGARAALFAGTLWLTSPYLFWYERMALSDAEAGALVALALITGLRLAHTAQPRVAVVTGLLFGVACLFKFTALPFALSFVVIVLFLTPHTLITRVRLLVIIGLVTGACFIVPAVYLLLRGRDLFSTALNWVAGGSMGEGGVMPNLARLWTLLTGFGTSFWSLALFIGLLGSVVWGGRLGRVLVAALLVPLAAIILLGNEVLSRHYAVALPLALTLGALGIHLLTLALPARRLSAALTVGLLSAGFAAFALPAYRDPASAPLPSTMQEQYITQHPSGYGLRAAVEAFPSTLADSSIPRVASMFPDSCRRANFYAPASLALTCTAAPGTSIIETVLREQGRLYLLVDDAPRIGADVTRFDADALLIATYPRPHNGATVTLWLLQRRAP